jgi:hypothetical protein
MTRPRKLPLANVSHSPAACAAALDIRADYLHEAVANKVLPSFKLGNQTRVLIVDLIAWVRTWDGDVAKAVGRTPKRRAKAETQS